jgi:hypothetical protein
LREAFEVVGPERQDEAVAVAIDGCDDVVKYWRTCANLRELITQSWQVQILPPLPRSSRSEALSGSPDRAFFDPLGHTSLRPLSPIPTNAWSARFQLTGGASWALALTSDRDPRLT